MSYITYKNSKYEILKQPHEGLYIKDIDTQKIYYKEELNLDNVNFDTINTLKWSYKDSLLTLLITISIILFFYLSYYIFTYPFPHLSVKNSIYSFLFLLINVVAHELAHSSTLAFFGKKRGKYTLKWFWFFPIIMVDTSEAYMLPKFEAISVCYAGIMTNIFLSSFIFMISKNISYITIPVYNLIVFNLLPLGKIKTDGYHILINFILGITDYRFRKSKIMYSFELLFYLLAIFIAFKILYSLFI